MKARKIIIKSIIYRGCTRFYYFYQFFLGALHRNKYAQRKNSSYNMAKTVVLPTGAMSKFCCTDKFSPLYDCVIFSFQQSLSVIGKESCMQAVFFSNKIFYL